MFWTKLHLIELIISFGLLNNRGGLNGYFSVRSSKVPDTFWEPVSKGGFRRKIVFLYFLLNAQLC